MRVKLEDLEGRLGEAARLREIMEFCGVSKGGPWLAGGSVRRWVRGEPLDSDFDLFFRDEAQHAALAAKLGEPVLQNDFAQTWEPKVGEKPARIQAIHFRYFKSLAAVLDSFDFTVCQFGCDGAEIEMGDLALLDAQRKRLVVHRIEHAASSTRRLIKYTRQGYFACTGAIVAILEAVAEDPSIINADVLYID